MDYKTTGQAGVHDSCVSSREHISKSSRIFIQSGMVIYWIMDDDQSQDVLERAILDFTCPAQQLDVIQQETCLRLSFLEASAMVLGISFRVERKSKSFP